MPTIEVYIPPETVPLPRADTTCGWCHIRLSALPEQPKPYQPKGSPFILYYHPVGCISAARNHDAGVPRL